MATSGWNRSVNSNQATVRKPPRGFRGLIAGILVCAALAGVLFFVFTRGDSAPKDEMERHRGMIRAVTPAAAPKAEPVPEKPKKVYKSKEEQYFDETNGMSRMSLMKWRFQHRPPAGWTNDTSKTQAKPAYAIFEHDSENKIAALLTMEPGEMIIGDGGYDERFKRDFMKSCEGIITVTEDDTPEQVALKKQMIATKIELRDRMSQGEDICQIMRETREEYQRMSAMKSSVMDILRDMKKEGGRTMQEMEDSIAAANKMLSDKGVAPLKLTPLAKRMMMRHCTDYDPAKFNADSEKSEK